MPDTGTATVTATTGPGRTVTSKVIQNIQSFFVNINKRMIYFYVQGDDPSSPAREFALTATVTFTATIANGLWTITVAAS